MEAFSQEGGELTTVSPVLPLTLECDGVDNPAFAAPSVCMDFDDSLSTNEAMGCEQAASNGEGESLSDTSTQHGSGGCWLVANMGEAQFDGATAKHRGKPL